MTKQELIAKANTDKAKVKVAENKVRAAMDKAWAVGARCRAEKIKYLLLLLEDELRWFRDNGPDAREMFRRELDPFDIGYVSSLLTMLTEEDKFRRWLALTTARFQFFKKRRTG